MKTLKAFASMALSLAVGAAPICAQTAPALTKIGVAGAVQGRVLAFSPTAKPVGRIIESGLPLFLNEKVTTDGKGRMQILLMDETVFTIGPNSEMVLDNFVYDPATNSGKVSATIVKGVFRFVTGLIGHKNPSDMAVKFPIGTMGIRGTMVAGVVDSQGRATAVLLGPGPRMNAPGERVGAFNLANAGTTVEVTRPGFASSILAAGKPPTPAALLPPALLNAIQANLVPLPALPAASRQASASPAAANEPPAAVNADANSVQSPAAPAEADPNADYASVPEPPSVDAVPADMAPDPNLGDPNPGSATQAAGQDSASAAGTLDDTSSVGDLITGADGTVQFASQDILDFASLINNLSTWDQIRTIQTGGGFYSGGGTYSCSGGECGAGGSGLMNFTLNIDFGAQTVGGGSSMLQVSANPGLGLANSDSTLLNTVNYAGLTGVAGYTLIAAQGNHTNAAFDGTQIGLAALNGNPAGAALVSLLYKSPTLINGSQAVAGGTMAGKLTLTH